MTDFTQFQLPKNTSPQGQDFVSSPNLVAANKQFISPKYVFGKSGWSLFPDGSAEFASLFIPQYIKTVPLGGDIQGAINVVNANGGGEVRLAAGTYTLTSAITMKSNVFLTGAGIGVTILDCNNLSYNITGAGTGVYTTGTLSSVSGSSVVGSGTSWLANVTPLSSQIFLNNQWHLIAAVTDNTHIILAESYSGPSISAGSSYRIATPVQSIGFRGFTLKNSSGNGMDFDDCRTIIMQAIMTQDCNVGIDFTNCSIISSDEFISYSHTSNGASFTNCGIGDFEGFDCLANGGHGVVLNNVTLFPFGTSASDGNTTDGFNITSGTDVLLEVEASDNGGQGIKFVTGNENIMIADSIIERNTNDGIKISASSNYCRINNSYFKSNGGWGVNVLSSSCNNNILATNNFNGNSSGTISNSGTGTITRGNNGFADVG